MSVTEQASKVAGSVVDALKAQPLALALIVMNMLFVGVGYMVWSKTQERRSDFVATIMKSCLEETSKPSGYGPGVK